MFKKLLIGIAVVAMILGCTSMQVAKQTTEVPYYETVYWGEDLTCDVDNITFIGQCAKTQQVYPEKDLYWVTTENSNGDEVIVTLIWDMPESPAIGTCFYNSNTEEENCGVIFFDSLTGKHIFMNEMDASGVIDVQVFPQGVMRASLKDQIKTTEDLTIGEPCNYCKFIEEQFNTEVE